jgi:formylglycine-generating enzyme required for sulfatase activity
MCAEPIELPALGRFVALPAGSFMMGNERPVTEWGGDVRPEHARNGPARPARVARSFAMLDAPVTVAAFRAAEIEVAEDAAVFCLPSTGSIHDRWERRPFWDVNDSPDLPVVGVTWDEAWSFCETMSRRSGFALRLPTEIEWEYACRAGTTSLYFWGDDVRLGRDYAWFDVNSGMRVHTVRENRANPWGLFDMAGNVWEWCAPEVHRHEDALMPVRGGSACHHATSGRSAHHFEQPRAQRNAFLGFRCVLEVGS